ncbi:MAG: PEGA domain-containing protein [Myxococcota bacterium]
MGNAGAPLLRAQVVLFAVAVLLSAGPARAASPPVPKRVLVMNLKAAGVPDAVAQQATAFMAEPFEGRDEYTVITMDDISRLVSVEKSRQMLGCDANFSCLAELASGAKADLILSGTVGAVGRKLTVNLVLIETATAHARNRASGIVDRAKELAKLIPTLVANLFGWTGAAQGPRFKLAAGQAVSFAVLDLVPTGVSEQVATNLTQVLSVEIKRIQGASVISRDDIRAMMALEEDKARLGCDEASCLAEIGGALGVDKLIVGTVGKLSESYLVSLRLISVKTVKVESRISESFTGSEDQLIRAIRHAGRKLLGIEAPQGTLAVSTSVEGAELRINEQLKGKLPMAPLALPAGPHTVRISRGGYFDFNGDVYVDPAENTPLWVELRSRPLQWYQRWWVWALAAGASAATLLTLGAMAGGTATLMALVLRPRSSTGSGTATVD